MQEFMRCRVARLYVRGASLSLVGFGPLDDTGMPWSRNGFTTVCSGRRALLIMYVMGGHYIWVRVPM
jgi:hypothetical protein